ncbi:hypothetical protein AQUCO_01300832v1 [Aquilegia coerulea]|uniref:Oleosin n=1 Tax=Aquilegia coerulea TaxID=218851 RepID=A0A2G5E3M7_AQUCA|nr:hypothetical protein AQUCO_01300832v1 [Aquilegia coerulea]
MADRFQHQAQQQIHGQQPSSTARQVVKATTAVTLGGTLLMLSGLILAGTVIALCVATPVMVLFSPVLVPAVITVGLVIAGFLTSGGFGVAAVTVLTWMYKSMTGQNVPNQLASKAKDIKEHLGGQAQAQTRSIA